MGVKRGVPGGGLVKVWSRGGVWGWLGWAGQGWGRVRPPCVVMAGLCGTCPPTMISPQWPTSELVEEAVLVEIHGLGVSTG